MRGMFSEGARLDHRPQTSVAVHANSLHGCEHHGGHTALGGLLPAAPLADLQGQHNQASSLADMRLLRDRQRGYGSPWPMS
jgi:hypothetical protein